MQHHKLVLPEHLNQFGFLFGGHLLKWVDEVAWIAASLEFAGHRFVTVALDRVEFRHSIHQGAILEFSAERARLGTTSVSYTVEVREAPQEEAVFSTTVTLVRVNPAGHKQAIDPPTTGSGV